MTYLGRCPLEKRSCMRRFLRNHIKLYISLINVFGNIDIFFLRAAGERRLSEFIGYRTYD